MTAPLPGRIIELKVKVGDTVKAGDEIAVLELSLIHIYLVGIAGQRFLGGEIVSRSLAPDRLVIGTRDGVGLCRSEFDNLFGDCLLYTSSASTWRI